MEFEDLERRWKEQDAKLDAGLRLNARVLRESVLGKTERTLRWTGRGLILEALLGFVPVIWLGSFIADHLVAPRLWLPAAFLDAFAIAAFSVSIRHAVVLRSIDWSAPILAIQSQLAALRRARARATLWTLAVSPLLWAPLVVVAFEGFLGVDISGALAGTWLAWNVVFGLVVLTLAIWVARRHGQRLARVPVLRVISRELGGRRVAEAQGFLESLRAYDES